MPLVKLLRKLPIKISGDSAQDIEEIATFINRELLPFLAELRESTASDFEDIPTNNLLGRDTDGNGPVEHISLDDTLEFSGSQVLRRSEITGDGTIPTGSNILNVHSWDGDDATYLVRTNHANLSDEIVATDNTTHGITIVSDYDTAGFVSWRFGAQTDGTWIAQLFDDGTLDDSPRAFDISDSLGDGLEYSPNVNSQNAPYPFVVEEFTVPATAAGLSHSVTMPVARLPGDRIIIEMRLTALDTGASALSMPANFAYMEGESFATDGIGSCEVIELIITQDLSNDTGASISIATTVTCALSCRVLLVRDSNASLPGQCRSAFSTTSLANRDVGVLLAPWREANGLWGCFVGNNNNLALITVFPGQTIVGDFDGGQGQQSVAITSHNHTIGYCWKQIRAGDVDTSTWTFSASPRSCAINWVIAPRETGQIALSESASIPAQTILGNLFDYSAEARSWDLNDLAADGLSVVNAVSNGPFPEALDVPGGNTLIDVVAFTHNIVPVATEAGQGLLIVISHGGNTAVDTITDATAARNWQSLGSGLGTSHRMTLFYITPQDMTEAVANNTDPIVITVLTTAHALVVRQIPINDAHPTQLPTVSAFTIQNGTSATTTNDVGNVTPVPGDGSAEANYLYLCFLSTATEDSIVSAFPTNYVDVDGVAGGNQVFVASGTANIDNSLAYCQRQVRGSSENPSTFTYAASGNGRSIGVNVAIIPASVSTLNVSATWANVLENGRNSGAFNPIIDTPQYLGFGDPAVTDTLGGQIRADNLGLNLQTSGNFLASSSGGANLQLTSTTGIFDNAAGNLIIRTTAAAGGSISLSALTSMSLATTGGDITLDPSAGNFVNISSPGMLRFTEQASSSIAVASGFGAIWVRNDAPSYLMYTDDTDTDSVVLTGVRINGTDATGRPKVNLVNTASLTWATVDDSATDETELRGTVIQTVPGLDDILSVDNNTGANNIHIDAGQFIGFGAEGSLPASGQIRSSAAFSIVSSDDITLTGLDVQLAAIGSMFVDCGALDVECSNLSLSSSLTSIDLSSATDLTMSAAEDATLGCDIFEITPSVGVHIEGAAYLQMAEQANRGSVVPSGKGKIWVLNQAPTSLMFTDDEDEDWRLGYAAVQVITTNAAATNATTNLSGGSFTIPANTLRVGALYRNTLAFMFQHTAATTPTLTAELLIAGAVAQSAVFTPLAFAATFYGEVVAMTTIRTLGAGGTCMVSMQFRCGIANSLGDALAGSGTVATTAIDTTLSRTIELRIRMTTAVASNTLTVIQGFTERLS